MRLFNSTLEGSVYIQLNLGKLLVTHRPSRKHNSHCCLPEHSFFRYVGKPNPKLPITQPREESPIDVIVLFLRVDSDQGSVVPAASLVSLDKVFVHLPNTVAIARIRPQLEVHSSIVTYICGSIECSDSIACKGIASVPMEHIVR